MNTYSVRELLIDEDKQIFDKIENHTLLGASNHIKCIGKMFENISRQELYDNEKRTRVKNIAKYYIETRGKASQAITNAIYIMLNGIDKIEGNNFEKFIKNNIRKYFEDSDKNLEKIITYSCNLSRDFNNLLLYDYSSTVEKFIVELMKDNKQRKLYIPESRCIDGGYPYVKAFYNIKNIRISFIPDAAIMYFIKDVDACFMGAETVYPDGTGFNTIGSDLVGLVCKKFNVPLYFITPMIKLDTRNLYGNSKTLVIDDLKNQLSNNWDGKMNTESIDFDCPELIGVKPAYIDSFITEYGIIPAKQFLSVALDYENRIKGDMVFDE